MGRTVGAGRRGAALIGLVVAVGTSACGSGAEPGVAQVEVVGSSSPDEGAQRAERGAGPAATSPPATVTGPAASGVPAVAVTAEGSIDLSSAARIEGTVEAPLDRASYTFTGAENDEITVALSSVAPKCDDPIGLAVTIDDDTGAELFRDAVDFYGGYGLSSHCIAYGPYRLPREGTYTLNFEAGSAVDDSGPFSATVYRRRPAAARPIDLSAPADVSGEISHPRDSASFAFAGSKDQEITVTLTTVARSCTDPIGLTIVVADGQGAEVDRSAVDYYGGAPDHCGGYGPYVLPADGSYTVSFQGGPELTDTGAYQATIRRR